MCASRIFILIRGEREFFILIRGEREFFILIRGEREFFILIRGEREEKKKRLPYIQRICNSAKRSRNYRKFKNKKQKPSTPS